MLYVICITDRKWSYALLLEANTGRQTLKSRISQSYLLASCCNNSTYTMYTILI